MDKKHSDKTTVDKLPKHNRAPRRSLTSLSIGGHRNLTILVVSLLLFIAACVYFVNAVVLTNGTDEAYFSEATTKANPIKFNESVLKQAQTFDDNTNNTSLPAGRINPFAQ